MASEPTNSLRIKSLSYSPVMTVQTLEICYRLRCGLHETYAVLFTIAYPVPKTALA